MYRLSFKLKKKHLCKSNIKFFENYFDKSLIIYETKQLATLRL